MFQGTIQRGFSPKQDLPILRKENIFRNDRCRRNKDLCDDYHVGSVTYHLVVTYSDNLVGKLGGKSMKKKLLSICLWIAMVGCLTGCGKGSVYVAHDNDYTQITSVQGVSFDMPSYMLSQATAISAIFQNEEYSGAYVYRDGESKYIMFDMEQIVVACGVTDFNFQGNENEETLESDDIEGVWMSKSGEKFSYDKDDSDGIYKIVADVNAEFSVTPNQYGEYTGKMASINAEGQEWSIFAGAKTNGTELSKSQDKIITHIVKSFEAAQNLSLIFPDTETTSTEVITIPETEELFPEQTEVAESETETEIEMEPETGTEEDVPKEEETSKEETEPEEEVTSTENTNPEEEGAGAISEEGNSVPAEEPEEKPLDPVLTGKLSDIYNPIGLGEWSNASGQNAYGELENGYVRIDSVITGKEAADFVQKYGEYKDTAMDGTAFEVVEYSTTINPERAYLDVRFEGVDGERLKLRGVSYTTRTYDVLSLVEEKDGVYTKLYAYYEVPTGCKEYLLETGLQIRDISVRETCCYLRTEK